MKLSSLLLLAWAVALCHAVCDLNVLLSCARPSGQEALKTDWCASQKAFILCYQTATTSCPSLKDVLDDGLTEERTKYLDCACIPPAPAPKPTCPWHNGVVPPNTPCASNPCLNGGTCVPLTNPDGSSGYVCDCPAGYIFEQRLGYCALICLASNPCQNGGTCMPIAGSNGHTCTCPASFSGPNCETGGSGGCFPADASVLTPQGEKSMAQLRVGDVVQVWHADTDELSWASVELFLDRAVNASVVLVHITLADGTSIALTPKHVLPVREQQQLDWKWASQVHVGHSLHTRRGWSNVTSVGTRIGTGAFAPLTSTGTVVVDGVSASCFAWMRHQSVSYWATRPAVWLSKWTEESSEEGVHWWAALLVRYASPLVSITP